MSIDYRKSGVNIDAGDALVDWLQADKSTAFNQKFSKYQVSGIGGFAAITRLPFQEFNKPCLVTSTDGVGTKVKLASQFQKFDTVGQDLVAMCVNDLVTCGAKPFVFLDYYAVGKLNLEEAKIFLSGVRAACEKSDCALVGGETAEMPGVYQIGDFDCAGFAVGLVEEDQILGPHRVQIGYRALGVASSGFHSNGYSLLRRVFEKDLESWATQLLRPTHLYVELAMSAIRLGGVGAMAHITGGGMENIPRVMPEGTQLKVQDWQWPHEFIEVQKRSGMERKEMMRTLNCGVGFVLLVEPSRFEKQKQMAEKLGFRTMDLGVIEKGQPGEPQVYFGDGR